MGGAAKASSRQQSCLSVAAFAEGRQAQAFPSFGSERMGAPVVSFCRIDDRPIRTREPVMAPDALVIQDATLLHQVDLFAGLSQDGLRPRQHLAAPSMSSDSENSLRGFRRDRLRHLSGDRARNGTTGRPLPNAALLGGFAALTGEITLDAIESAIRERFAGPTGERNVAAATAAYRPVTLEGEELRRCCSKLRDRARSPRRWRAVGPRSSAPTRSHRRPTSSRRSARW